MRLTRPGCCCARGATGHTAAAAPPMTVMNSRRLTASASRASDRKDNTPQLRQETAALRDFVPAYDRCGSFSRFEHEVGITASPQ